MVYFRKRLTPEILGEINEMIVQDAKARQAEAAESKDDDDGDKGSGAGGNRGTMIVDATCAPSHIRYPQDVSCSTRPGKTQKSFWTASMPLRMARGPAPIASAPEKII